MLTSLFFFLTQQLAFSQPATSFIIKAGKLFDSEIGVFKTDQVIFVKNGRIEDVKMEKDVTETDRKQYKLIDLAFLQHCLLTAHVLLRGRLF